MHTRRMRPAVVIPGCLILLLCSALLSLQTATRRDITVGDVGSVLARRGLGWEVGHAPDRIVELLVWDFGVPRVALAALVGAGLALAGVAAQALVRNPLAEPAVLGTSGGAVLGAVVAAVMGASLTGVVVPAGAAILGAVGALLLVMVFARQGNGGSASLRLILCGIAIGQMLIALASFLILRKLDASVTSIQLWTAGNIENAKLDRLWLPAIVLSLAMLALALDSNRMNALLIGDETATSLGINVVRLRWRLILVTGVLVGVMVSQSGIIGFVGLVVPHAARLLVGSDHRLVLPFAAVGGATYLVFCDFAARTIVAPQYIPIGIVAGGLGAPVFLWLVGRGMSRQST